jgi:hypothetical protein
MGKDTRFRLKRNVPDIEVVDGPFARRKFSAGETYTEIPPELRDRFEAVESTEDQGSSPAEALEKEKGGRKK